MSDKDEPEFHGFPLPIPEQLVEQFVEHKKHMEMHADAQLHAIIGAFEEMDLDHLRAMKALVSQVSDDDRNGGFWGGIIIATLARRQNVCAACGKNHDEEAAKLLVSDGNLGASE